VIDFVNGKIAYQRNDYVVIEVYGLGYQVFTPYSSHLSSGEEVMLLTHCIIREDAHLLYGFQTEEERDLFRLLLEVAGVGPKVAMAILSSGDLQQFICAIQREDVEFLTRLPGIGKKTAQRIVIEIKDKLKNWKTNSIGETFKMQEQYDVIDALLALGYNEKEAIQAVQQAFKSSNGKELSMEDWIKKALQVSSRK
jgi:holliday junction DNA helicase RuvA